MPKALGTRAEKTKKVSGLTAADRQWLGGQFKKIDFRFERVESQLDRIVNKLVDHEDRLITIETNMVTKDEFRIESDRVNGILDKQTKILITLDHEQTATRVELMRHEEMLSQ